jgi:hypothetical protein
MKIIKLDVSPVGSSFKARLTVLDEGAQLHYPGDTVIAYGTPTTAIENALREATDDLYHRLAKSVKTAVAVTF